MTSKFMEIYIVSYNITPKLHIIFEDTTKYCYDNKILYANLFFTIKKRKFLIF